ncbi:MAG TPA: hypothetical protein DCZ72_13525 [Armatimonadetes bacterium]|nr:hypothetical protein [Armatimonadota bacterium]
MRLHIITNAHLDPIWLWPWTTGVDAALATVRSACERLEAHPDVRFTRGEAWVYWLVEQLDPALFARVCALIERGQWEIAGGWWVQPDCNAPSGEGLRQQIRRGLDYFEERFSFRPRTAFNPDSFGHAATLPRLLNDAGQDSYVFMRPGAHEANLPARLFRWRGEAGGPEVLAYRLPWYTTGARLEALHIERAIEGLPPGVEDALLMVGVGDHGGGPTERQLAWLRVHWQSWPAVELRWSTLADYFDAVRPLAPALPLVTGELQHHAIGCYTVHRGVKLAARHADHVLRQAEIAGAPEADLEAGWREVCFQQFHDTLGGTCLPSAYEHVVGALGGVAARAEQWLAFRARQQTATFPPSHRQRLAVWNPGQHEWSGLLHHEVWTEGGWRDEWGWRTQSGTRVPHQVAQSEAAVWPGGCAAVLLPVTVPAGEWRVFELDQAVEPLPVDEQLWVGGTTLAAAHGPVVRLAGETGLQWPAGPSLPLPRFDLVDDASDTWSHDIDRYAEEAVETAVWTAPATVEEGPLRAAVIQHGTIGSSELRAEWRIVAGQAAVELELTVDWRQRHQLLRMVLPAAGRWVGRLDGIPGGTLERVLDGAERPLADWTLLDTGDGWLSVVCPETYALSVTPWRAAFTLLRSPVLAHHDPFRGDVPRPTWADQGRHTFRFRFELVAEADAAALRATADAWQQPPVVVSLTDGMSAWPEQAKM